MNTIMLVEQKKTVKEEKAFPRPERGEVIVEVAYCGICRTDRKSYRLGQRDLHMPRVLGHEFSGIIAATGEGITDYAIGDRVAVYPGIGCGHCPDCLEGNDQRCREMKILGFHLDGGFSRYCRIPAEGIHHGILCKVPPQIPLKDAAKCEPLGCALHMLAEVNFEKARHILICGGGVLGYLTAMLCRHYGAETILISEPNERKRRLCEESGFTAVFPEELDSYVKKHYPRGMDAAIPCTPHTECFEESLNLLKNGGFFGFFSGLVGETSLPLSLWNQIHYKELTMIGAYGCGKKDFKNALALLEGGFDLSPLPVTYISLDDVEEVLKQEETEHAVLTMIEYKTEAQI